MPGTPIEHFEYTVNEWRTPQFQRFLEPLRNIRNVFDIGANAGGFSQVVLERFPKALIVAVEPIPETYKFLADKFPSHLVYEAAIQYGTEETRMFWRGSNMGAYFTEEVNAGDDKIYSGMKVKCMTLEQFPIFPDLVKLDVEGAEENIIEHSEVLKTTPWIIVEWHPDTDPFKFFNTHLPDHKIIENLENKQFLLWLKNPSLLL